MDYRWSVWRFSHDRAGRTDRNIRTVAQRVIEALGERLAGTWRETFAQIAASGQASPEEHALLLAAEQRLSAPPAAEERPRPATGDFFGRMLADLDSDLPASGPLREALNQAMAANPDNPFGSISPL